MQIRFKKLNARAVSPFHGTADAAGYDLTATSFDFDPDHQCYVYETGIAVEIPKGYVGLVFPRSSSFKMAQFLSNSVGVIDSDYRGEIKFMYKSTHGNGDLYRVGDRIGQLVIVPILKCSFVESEELSETSRGSGGYGSTGR